MYSDVKQEKKGEIDWEDPFFAPVKRSQEAAESGIHLPTTTTEEFQVDQA